MTWKQSVSIAFVITGLGYYWLGVGQNDPLGWAVVSMMIGVIGGAIFGTALWAFARVLGAGGPK